MLDKQTRDLCEQFKNHCLDAMCDTSYSNAVSFIDISEFDFLQVRQAWSVAVMYAASCHIENCYDTPHDGTDRSGSYLDPQRYIDWMNTELQFVRTL